MNDGSPQVGSSGCGYHTFTHTCLSLTKLSPTWSSDPRTSWPSGYFGPPFGTSSEPAASEPELSSGDGSPGPYVPKFGGALPVVGSGSPRPEVWFLFHRSPSCPVEVCPGCSASCDLPFLASALTHLGKVAWALAELPAARDL